tara:strand:- start:717 stop:938 length:222 start_codon:yes stop_codon:yes gene_type:complete
MEMEEFSMFYSDDISDLFLSFKEINKNNGYHFLNNKNDNSYDLMYFLYNHIHVLEDNDFSHDLIIDDHEYYEK